VNLALPTIRDNGFNTRLILRSNDSSEWKMDSSIVVPDAMPILFPFEAVADTDVKKRMESAGLVCRVHVKGREIKYTPNPVYCLCLLKECLKEDLPDQPGLISYAPS
jgi:hypothetical protein